MESGRAAIQAGGVQRQAITDRLRLEVAVVDPRAAVARTSGGAGSDAAAGRTVLVVDDDPEMRAYIVRCLQRLAQPLVRVEEAADGEAAVARLKAGRVDLVITDVVMPRMDGYELVARLRSDPSLHAIPVLVVSGEVSLGELLQRTGSTGTVQLLTKPFSARMLGEAVRLLLGA